MQDRETLVVIQARCASMRLPGKALLPLGGKPMLAFLLERLREVSGQLCLATTVRPEDEVLADWARKIGMPAVRGEEDDVLARYLQCLERFPARAVIRVTADNPLTCPGLVDAAARLVLDGADYAALPEGCPVGLAADGFSAEALFRMAEAAREADEREHINLHVLRHSGSYRIADPILLRPSTNRPDIRLTVDVEEDYTRVRRFVEEGCGGRPPRTPEEIVEAYDRAALR